MKRPVAWVLVLVGVLGVVLSYFAVWGLVVLLAAGVVWWANAALIASGPVAGVGALIARHEPRQSSAMRIGLVALAAWTLLWILMLTVLGFRFHGD